MNTPKTPHSKTFRDSLIDLLPPETHARVALTNGVLLNGEVFEINQDHLVMEDRRSQGKQLVRFEAMASVGESTVRNNRRG